MTEKASMPPEMSPRNLAILKGITVGLGVLLILGTVLIGVKMASGLAEKDAPVNVVSSSGRAPITVDVAALPPLPLRFGETIIQATTGDGHLVVLMEAPASPAVPVAPRRILMLDLAVATSWVEVPQGVVAEAPIAAPEPSEP